MAKATLNERIASLIWSKTGATLRRFVEVPVRAPQSAHVGAGTVYVDNRTLSAIVATGATRILHVYDDDLDAYIQAT